MFHQTGDTKDRSLFRASQVRKAVAASDSVFVVEGEKDVLALESVGAVATCNPMGAGKFDKIDPTPLTGANVFVWPDADEVGRKHAAQVCAILAPIAASVTIVRSQHDVKDAADHVAAGYGIPDDLIEVPPDVIAAPTAKLVTLSNVKPERVEWLWNGRIPARKVTVVDGDPSTGKSTLTVDIAARVSAGRDWPDGQPGSALGGVLLLSAEDGLADTIVPRLHAAGANLGNVHALTEVPNPEDPGRMVPPSLPADIPVIRDLIRRNGIRLVIIDVFMAYLSGRVDSHRDQDVRAVLHLLGAVAEETGAAIILIRHLNKTSGGSALYRGGGSIGIIGAARAAFLVARDPDDPDRRILAPTKMNIAAEPPALAYRLESVPEFGCARVVWEPEPVDLDANALLRAPESTDERSELDAAVDWLRHYLESCGATDRSATVKAAGKDAGFSERTIQRARQRLDLEVETRIEPGGRAGVVRRVSYWSLPNTQDVGTTDPVGTTGPDLGKRDDALGTTVGTTGPVGTTYSSASSDSRELTDQVGTTDGTTDDTYPDQAKQPELPYPTNDQFDPLGTTVGMTALTCGNNVSEDPETTVVLSVPSVGHGTGGPDRCRICDGPIYLHRPGRDVCDRRDPEHEAARAA